MESSGLLQRFHDKGTLCDGNSFPPGFPIPLNIQDVFLIFFPGIVIVQFSLLKDQTIVEEREKMIEIITDS